jgi:hypothetical protein
LIPELKDLSKSIPHQQNNIQNYQNYQNNPQNNQNNPQNQHNNQQNNQQNNNNNNVTSITSQEFRSGSYSQMYPYSNSYLTNIM